MPTTPQGFPYPTPDDPVSLGANDIRALAEAADARTLWTLAAGVYAKTPNHAVVNKSLGLDELDQGVNAPLAFGSTRDTTLYRDQPNVLRTPGKIFVDGPVYASLGPLQVGVGSYSGYAGITFGSLADANIYRNAAGQVRSDGVLMASQLWALGGPVVSNYGGAGQVSLTTPGGQPGIRFGTDTDLYRYQAGGLVIDGFFRVGGAGAGAEQSGLELYIDGAWRRVSRRSDGVMIC